MDLKNKYVAIGVMSGTSLDGLDIAACEFAENNNKWEYNVLAAETFHYSNTWTSKLSTAHSFSGIKLHKTHVEYGKLIGKAASDFIIRHKISPLLIASHGHTIFHQPAEGFTLQIGDGASISSITKLPAICDFRSGDISLGGQGAPLVPAGEIALFNDFSSLLNIGGFANISFHSENIVTAWDVCPANIILNYLARKEGKAFDKNGEMAASGTLIDELLNKINNLPYYFSQPPKSLGREWVETEFLPLLNSGYTTIDLLRTVTEHIAIQISLTFKKSNKEKLLISGGGAMNTFLTSRLKHYLGKSVCIPDQTTIEYKEAIIFAFLGLLRWLNRTNTLSTVTGASSDSCGGAVYNSFPDNNVTKEAV